jgi:AcrR family transcriptional regulator
VYGSDTSTRLPESIQGVWSVMARLTRTSWVEAGLEALRRDGPSALAAEPMARELGVSRGSFYWHFENALDFQAAVLGQWEEQWTSRIIAAVENSAGDPQKRLQALIQKTGGEDASVYASAKAMARLHPEFQDMMSRVDERRISFVGSLLVEGGVPARVAKLRSQVIYAWAMGQMLISGDRQRVPPAVAEALIAFAFDQAK